jgi:hypothetical protein
VETNAYLNILGECDVALSSFPFGGLHSTIDALLLGLPVVALQGQEPHARTDSLVIRRLGLPDWLVAKTEQDYVRAALRVITDDEERLSLGQAVLAANPWEKFFGSYPSGLESVVSDAIWVAYLHHEGIKGSGLRVWRFGDLQALQQSLDSAPR